VERGGGREERQTCARDEICPSDSEKIRKVSVLRSNDIDVLGPGPEPPPLLPRLRGKRAGKRDRDGAPGKGHLGPIESLECFEAADELEELWGAEYELLD
jgi:hypothetical protein